MQHSEIELGAADLEDLLLRTGRNEAPEAEIFIREIPSTGGQFIREIASTGVNLFAKLF